MVSRRKFIKLVIATGFYTTMSRTVLAGDPPTTVYVDHSTPAGGDGSVDWPYSTVQQALEVADESTAILVRQI